MSGRAIMWAGVLGTYLWLAVLTGRLLRDRIRARLFGRLCEGCEVRPWRVALEDAGELWWLCTGCAEAWSVKP